VVAVALAVADFIFHFVVYFSLPLHFPSSIGFHLVRGSLMKAGGGRREPPAVACSSRNAA